MLLQVDLSLHSLKVDLLTHSQFILTYRQNSDGEKFLNIKLSFLYEGRTGMKKRTLLRKLLERDTILMAPSAWDCLSAKMIEKTGFEAVGTTGFGMSASMLGQPDVGLVTMTEAVRQVRNMAGAVNIPILVDGEAGYGNAVNVMRTVREFEKAGAAAIFIEDQVTPVKCAAMGRKQVIPLEEMIGKIKAALEARDDSDFIICARTDADIISKDEVIKRCNAYAKAGADMVKPMPSTLEDFELYAKHIKAPMWITYPSRRTTWGLTVKRLEELGYKIVAFPLHALFAATRTIRDVLKEIKEKETAPLLMTIDEFWEFIGLQEIRKLEEKYIVKYQKGYP